MQIFHFFVCLPGNRFMFRLHAGRTEYQAAETVPRRGRERAATRQCRIEVWQLLLPAHVVRRLHGEMVCIASKSIRKGGLAATEVHVSHVSGHILHSRRVLHRIGAHVIFV